jgi:hypothetical protein
MKEVILLNTSLYSIIIMCIFIACILMHGEVKAGEREREREEGGGD